MNTHATFKSSGISSVAANASTSTPLNSQLATRVIINNTASGSVAITVSQDGGSDVITIPAAGMFQFDGLRNATQLSVKAASGTPTVSYRWLH
jgi:hypothetical protein